MQTVKSWLQKMMARLRSEEELYVVMSMCTHMPFVYCTPETYDDVVFLYFTREEAQEGTKWLLEAKNPIQLAKIDKEDRLAFFTSLYPMGVNAIALNYRLSEQIVFQLNDLVRRQSEEQMPKGQMRIENPEFHLTALYFSQELKKGMKRQEEGLPEELNALNEELIAHFRQGTFLVAAAEGNKRPILEKGEMSYQPLFTDLREFQKFDREKKFQAMVVKYENIPKMLPKGTDGVTVNPLGVDIVLKIAH